MSKSMILDRIHELEAKLRHVTKFDLWHLWTWEEDQELANLRAKLVNWKA